MHTFNRRQLQICGTCSFLRARIPCSYLHRCFQRHWRDVGFDGLWSCFLVVVDVVQVVAPALVAWGVNQMHLPMREDILVRRGTQRLSVPS